MAHPFDEIADDLDQALREQRTMDRQPQRYGGEKPVSEEVRARWRHERDRLRGLARSDREENAGS